MDMDFIGFTYNGKHSFRDLNIYRTSNGSRYNDNLNATLTDKTADVPGSNGQYYFGTTHKNKTFSVSYAFDNLTESGLRLLKQTFDGKDIHDLIFDEEPYKVWSAKVTGTAQIKHLCFEENEGQRTYKGEGSITFTCYYPYAHTPNQKEGESVSIFELGSELICGLIIPPYSTYSFNNADDVSAKFLCLNEGVWQEVTVGPESNLDDAYYFIESITVNILSEGKISSDFSITINDTDYVYTTKKCFECNQDIDGRDINYYSIVDYPNKKEWVFASGLKSTPTAGENYGDIPTHFTYILFGNVDAETPINVGNNEITIKEGIPNLSWDSKTGIVGKKGKDDKIVPIRYTGNSLATIPTGENKLTISPKGTLTYNYWYY